MIVILFSGKKQFFILWVFLVLLSFNKDNLLFEKIGQYGMVLLPILLLLEQFLQILTTSLQFDIKKKEAHFQNYLGKKAIREIIGIEIKKIPFLWHSLIIKGKGMNDMISIPMIKNLKLAEDVVDKFYNSK